MSLFILSIAKFEYCTKRKRNRGGRRKKRRKEGPFFAFNFWRRFASLKFILSKKFFAFFLNFLLILSFSFPPFKKKYVYIYIYIKFFKKVKILHENAKNFRHPFFCFSLSFSFWFFLFCFFVLFFFV